MAEQFDPDVLLHAPLMANLATVCADGPRNAPMWFLWEAGVLWLLGDAGSSSVRRIADDSRVAVEIVQFDPQRGILLHVGLRGKAEITPMDRALFRRLLAKYLGSDPAAWNPWFVDAVAKIEDPNGRLIRLLPESIFTNNVSYFKTGPELAWP